MGNKNYYVSKNNDKRETVYFEYDKMNGYSVHPKVHKSDSIEVSKIVFVNPEFSEKIIRRKIDRRIESLLTQLKLIEEEDGSDQGTIQRNLMDAEKLRMQIINNYVKYLGNTYESLTMKKLQIIIDRLKYRLYIVREMEQENYYESQKEGRRGR